MDRQLLEPTKVLDLIQSLMPSDSEIAASSNQQSKAEVLTKLADEIRMGTCDYTEQEQLSTEESTQE